MPRYFFHVHDGERTAIGPEGVDLADEAAVREEAMEGARDIMSEGIMAGMDRSHWRFEIADASGAPLLMFRFTEAIKRKGGLSEFVRKPR